MVVDSTKPRAGLKQRRMARIKAEIQRCALELFRRQGFEETTVNQIATAAEVSPMTVFRYFATKEDIVVWDDFDEALVARIQESPECGDVITRVATVLLNSLADADDDARLAMLARLELAIRSSALRTRGWDNLYLTQQAITVGLGAANEVDRFRNSVAVGACLVALSAALFRWAKGQGEGDPLVFAREAFAVIGADLQGVGQ